jgi:hypothetical protein
MRARSASTMDVFLLTLLYLLLPGIAVCLIYRLPGFFPGNASPNLSRRFRMQRPSFCPVHGLCPCICTEIYLDTASIPSDRTISDKKCTNLLCLRGYTRPVFFCV